MRQDAAAEQREELAAGGAAYVYTKASERHADSDEEDPEPLKPHVRRRMFWVGGVLVVVGLLVVLPPLFNVSRYQRRIAASISASLGRPVHMDSVALNVLPMPGFTLTNFVVDEDPGFGAEPVIRADSVRVTLRMRSLWHRRVEFSRIALDSPSVNLVRRADGRWNIQSILMQASHVAVNPTEQRSAGDAPRFPYIEAKSARVNFKSGLEKKPLSLTDADFALWLPEPEMWRLRLEAHPTRTDTAATDTGTFRMEGTLGKAGALSKVPVDLKAVWSAVPLGAASWVVMGRDAGMRGEMTLSASVVGTVGENTSTLRLEAERVRRADFVPARSLSIDISCKAETTNAFHRLTGLKCLWPPEAEQSGLGGLTATGEIEDLRRPSTAKLDVEWNGVQVQDLMDALRVASARVSPELAAGGMVSGSWNCCGEGAGLGSSGEVVLSHLRVSLAGKPVHEEDEEIPGTLAGDTATMQPIALDLGGPQPALLSVAADAGGVTMKLSGSALPSKLLAFGKALPQFGDGLGLVAPVPAPGTVEVPVKVDLVGTRVWSGGMVWSQAAKVVVVKKKGRRR